MAAPRKLLIASSTRADWGLLSPLAHELRSRGADVTVAATNMHLLPECGFTVIEIEQEGFEPRRIPAVGSPAQISADVMRGFSDLYRSESFDAVIILGDRYEMLAAAMASVLHGVPVVHIAGGAVSYGAFDDGFRHAITKLAWLHFPETDTYRDRILAMGEDPERVITAGAIGVHNILSTPLMSRQELEDSLGFAIGEGTILVTMHAATLARVTPLEQYHRLMDALDRFPQHQILFTYPNNDTDPTPLVEAMRRYAEERPGRVCIVPSLGRVRYLSALKYVEAVVGNSSSGLVEVPSMGIPTLDIGHRQDGRIHGPSVIRCGEETEDIAEGLNKVLSPEMKRIAGRRDNPYCRPGTLSIMADNIMTADFHPFPIKIFHDIH